jgi:hypothetical protein
VANLSSVQRASVGRTHSTPVEPRALDVEELEAGSAASKREGVDGQLRDRLVCSRIWFVIEDVNGGVPDLHEINVAGNGAFPYSMKRHEVDTVLCLQRRDVFFGEPDRDLDRDRDAIVDEHEALEGFVPQLVVADGGDNKCGGLSSGIAF